MSNAPPRRLAIVFAALVIGSTATAADPGPGPFARFTLPHEWEAKFWADPDTQALLKLDPKDLAALVPTQAGLRFCRCPGCDADEASDPLIWSATRPKVVTCMRCGQAFPNEKVPAKEEKEKKVPEEAIDVLPGVTHHYPYHAVPAEGQKYPDERLYLDAKRDYGAREALAKAALYAAVRYHEQAEAGKKDDRLARFAAVLILRFAQVYPAYACHFDQPGQPKFFQPADLKPPYRRGYKTGKWEWTASLDVPLNLVTAYALIRDDPAWAEVGRLLDDPNPRRTIEHGFFRASAEFTRRQPEEFDEQSLQAYRGLFAVGRLLDDRALLDDARGRLAQFAERGFYHDGYWRQGDASAHRRVLQQLDGWIERLATDAPEPAGTVLGATRPRSAVPMLDLARGAGAASRLDVAAPEVQQASWPVPSPVASARRPTLLGGVGLARLSVGDDRDGLDFEIRGMGSLGSPHFQRQALRMSVAGQAVLDDLDGLPPTLDGWDLATASHNTVVVDGLNQRENPATARESALGGQFLYYAADPDFQVVALDDPLAYPRSTTRYRQIAVAAAGKQSRYAVTVFQVFGGLQHDQLFHGPAGGTGRWSPSTPMAAGPESLLPMSIPYLPNLKADDGRWFVQAFGEFRRLAEGRAVGPMSATLVMPGRPGVRLHLLGDMPLTVFTGLSPDPTRSRSPAVEAEAGEGRGSLILRRRSADGGTLRSTFVTVFEPAGGVAPPLKRVGRVGSIGEVILLLIETADGPEYLVVNLKPGTPQTVSLPDGRSVMTDGLVLRISPTGLQLAGGTLGRSEVAELGQDRLTGHVVAVGRTVGPETRGWFEVEGLVEQFAGVEGRTLLIGHGDGSVHGWTIQAIEPSGRKRLKLHVREEPGFSIDPRSSEARYYQFPRLVSPGPHQYSVSRVDRSDVR